MRPLAVVLGALVVTVVIGDAIETLVVTQGRDARWRPTPLWYFGTWRVTRALVSRLPAAAGDAVLNFYPALSLLGLLVVWLVGLVAGWTLVYWGLHLRVLGSAALGDVAYYAGTSLISTSFGSAHGTAARALSLLEALTGLGTIALLISYLPAMYGAYSRRETRLLTLDDPLGGRLTPVRVIAVHCGDGDVELLYRFFADWEMWTAEVLESHVSYPMLALFRSQHPGQSWVTALGVITDAATLTTACVAGADRREPYFLYRRGWRAVVNISQRLQAGAPDQSWTWLNRGNFDRAWDMLVELALPMRDKEDAWERLQELRAPYGAHLQQLIDFLMAPQGFWGHSAEATIAEELAEATAEARRRARQGGRGGKRGAEPAEP